MRARDATNRSGIDAYFTLEPQTVDHELHDPLSIHFVLKRLQIRFSYGLLGHAIASIVPD